MKNEWLSTLFSKALRCATINGDRDVKEEQRMKLEVTPKAQQWFKEETGVQPETGIRFRKNLRKNTCS